MSDDVDINGNATSLPNVIGAPGIVGNVRCWFYTDTNSDCRALAPNSPQPYGLPLAASRMAMAQ